MSSQLLIPPFKCKARKLEKIVGHKKSFLTKRSVKLSRHINLGGLLYGIEFVSETKSFLYLIVLM